MTPLQQSEKKYTTKSGENFPRFVNFAVQMVLFTHSYFYRFDEKQWRNRQPYPPYGTLLAAAVVRECGFETAFFDVALENDPARIRPVLQTMRPKYLIIYDDGFNYLTKMCLTRMREAAFALTAFGRDVGCLVVVCSSDSSDHAPLYLEKGADFVIPGEGEAALRALLVAAETCRDADDVRAQEAELIAALPYPVCARSAPAGQPDKKPQIMRDLDALPDPAWDLVDMAAYRAVWMRTHGYFSLNLATTRGCPYKCNWCAKPIYGNRYHARSPERVVAEIARLIHHYGATHFWMADDIFGLKPGWVQRFRALVQEQGLVFRYKIQSRADLLLQEDTIDALAASGADQVWIGAESGSQKILDAMDKGITIAHLHEATRLLRAKGIEVCFFLQFGYIGETADDIAATLQLLDTLQPDDVGISVSYPLPGTGFYEKVRATLGPVHNWKDSDDLALLYRSTYSPDFYRRLHRLVHRRFRMRRAQALLRRPAPLRHRLYLRVRWAGHAVGYWWNKWKMATLRERPVL